MSENETVADIIAEKRERADEIERDVAAKMASGEMVSDQYAREVIADLRIEADRLEAAAKREHGNAAAMREALLAVKKSIDGIGASSLDCDPEILMSALTQICARLSSRINAALSAPPRNFDVGTVEEWIRRHERYCGDSSESFACINGPGSECKKCFAKWLLLPYKKGGAV